MKFRYLGIIIFPALFILNGCGENSALKEETFYFEDKNLTWIPDYEVNQQFIMQDSNGISESYMLDEDSYYFNKSWGGFLGINTHMTHTEYHYQSYSSSFGNRFSVSLTAGWPPFGDELFVCLNNVDFAYDIKQNHLSPIYSDFGSRSHLMTEDGYEEAETILSRAEILSNQTINGTNYETVLHFEFNDFQDQQTDMTVKEIFIAKSYGLVQFSLNNGVRFHRSTGPE